MRQRIFFTEEAPYSFLIIFITIVKLMNFHFFELTDKLFVDGKILLAVGSWLLVLMVADTLTEEV